jgi:hypothetical protein
MALPSTFPSELYNIFWLLPTGNRQQQHFARSQLRSPPSSSSPWDRPLLLSQHIQDLPSLPPPPGFVDGAWWCFSRPRVAENGWSRLNERNRFFFSIRSYNELDVVLRTGNTFRGCRKCRGCRKRLESVRWCHT